MSNAYSHKALQAASLTSVVGCDPDGVVDNRPGISHPNMPRNKSALKDAKSLASRDLFSRDPQHGRDLVNNTHKTPGKQTDGKWVIGIGMRNPTGPNRKLNRKKRKQNGVWVADDEMTLEPLDGPETINEGPDNPDT
ncbi:MAG: hypothetical protein HOI23_06740 [Deltaproteobacteria bacterium]|jgi:hypothetical protein|nr:hypothetical protein [Deltaproteobacteria bacterium]MBT6489463.1 hypothetical protein [Deltaproteobacteria bacterium]